MPSAGLQPVSFMIFPTWEAALAAGFPDAEPGVFQQRPGMPDMIQGWQAMDHFTVFTHAPGEHGEGD